jgi:Tfp pilus assembly protein PilO
MSEHVYLLTIGLPLLTILIIFGMRYFSAILQALVRLARDEAYRQIAEKSAAAQSQNAAALGTIEASLSDVRTRLAAIEKILKDVE